MNAFESGIGGDKITSCFKQSFDVETGGCLFAERGGKILIPNVVQAQEEGIGLKLSQNPLSFKVSPKGSYLLRERKRFPWGGPKGGFLH